MSFLGKCLSVFPEKFLPAYESVFHQGCKDLLKQFMLGMLAEIPLILVVYTEMKQKRKYFIIKIIQAASKFPVQRKIPCIHANIEGFLGLNILLNATSNCSNKKQKFSYKMNIKNYRQAYIFHFTILSKLFLINTSQLKLVRGKIRVGGEKEQLGRVVQRAMQQAENSLLSLFCPPRPHWLQQLLTPAVVMHISLQRFIKHSLHAFNPERFHGADCVCG